ncbi:MAG: sulfotransferase [Sphingomonadales bacterium]
MRVLTGNGGVGLSSLPQAVAAVLSSLFRLPFSLADSIIVAAKHSSARPMEPPIFIVGHWRSGTTHLYNLMGQAGHFGFVTPFSTALPWDFLSLTKLFGGLLEKALPEGRYIDNIPVRADSPQEDEIGLANMTPISFYHGLYFPKRFHENFAQGIFFEGLTKARIGGWEKRLKYYYLKLQLAQRGTRLVIKNPVYTARIAHLLSIWPEAKFIHIHRNPYKVFFSMRNFYDKLLGQFALQSWRHLDLDAHILDSYPEMMSRLEEDAAGLGPEQFLEMRFEDLQSDPLGELGRIYRRFGLDGFDEARPRYEAYLLSVKGYSKNIYNYPADEIENIALRWGHFIRKWGYEPPGGSIGEASGGEVSGVESA